MKKNILYGAVLFSCVALTAFTLTEGNERGSHEIDAKVKAEVYKVLDDS